VKRDGRVLIFDLLASEDLEQAAYHNRLERLCDPSHVRALSETEFDRLFAQAGLTVVSRRKKPLRFAVDEWLIHGGPSEAATRDIVRLIDESLDGDLTGLRIEKEQNRLYFNHTIVTFVTTPE